jgi:hypothetical protein
LNIDNLDLPCMTLPSSGCLCHFPTAFCSSSLDAKFKKANYFQSVHL